LVEFSNGSIGRAMDIAALDLAPLESQALAILRGDQTIRAVSKLASSLAPKQRPIVMPRSSS
jgi:hypothetical protein